MLENLSILTLIWTTLEHIETMLAIVETTLWIWTLTKKDKKETSSQKLKNIFELQSF